jgi:hypothetical protein
MSKEQRGVCLCEQIQVKDFVLEIETKKEFNRPIKILLHIVIKTSRELIILSPQTIMLTFSTAVLSLPCID